MMRTRKDRSHPTVARALRSEICEISGPLKSETGETSGRVSSDITDISGVWKVSREWTLSRERRRERAAQPIPKATLAAMTRFHTVARCRLRFGHPYRSRIRRTAGGVSVEGRVKFQWRGSEKTETRLTSERPESIL